MGDRVRARWSRKARVLRLSLDLPQGLPHGVFRLRVTVAASELRTEVASLIVSPARAFQGGETAPQRMWALAVQLYGVRSRGNWGHGDFGDLLTLVDLAADLGAPGIGLNPLHALFDDRPEEVSPYFPNSRLFLNPLYIDVEAVPEFPGRSAAGLETRSTGFGNRTPSTTPALPPRRCARSRLRTGFFSGKATAQRHAAFDRFRQERGSTLARFACFEVLRRKFAGPWWQWPQQWQTGGDEVIDALRRSQASAVGFVEFVQWIAHEQLDRCRARARARGLPIGLYLDIAVGVRSDGFDAWCDQDAVLSGTAVGAPPDALNTSGQNWGLAGFQPGRSRRSAVRAVSPHVAGIDALRGCDPA